MEIDTTDWKDMLEKLSGIETELWNLNNSFNQEIPALRKSLNRIAKALELIAQKR